MPLTLAPVGETKSIMKIKGNEKVKKHLENLGFVESGDVQVISKLNGNMIVNVKGSRVAIDRELAMKIIV